MSYIVPNWSAPGHIKAFSTTRLGGVSRGAYSSMNLALHVGDEIQKVVINRANLISDLNLPSQPVWLQQVHSSDVLSADAPIESAADGSFSIVANTICAVMTADCLPLLLTNTSGDQVAAIHIGWRGMANGIIDNAIASFDCLAADIIAWAGPCIGATKFEIGCAVKSQLGGPDSAYSELKKNKMLANLYQLCGHRLAALGVNNYSHSQACTYLDEGHFFSYRRDRQCGRMASIIWIQQES